MNLRPIAVAALALMLVTVTANASVIRLNIGDRVRVTARSLDHKPIVGTIVRADSLKLTLAIDDHYPDLPDPTRSIAWQSLDALERSEGRHSNARKGAGYGAMAGLFGALGVLAVKQLAGEPEQLDDMGGIVLLGRTLLITGAGYAAGWGIGAAIQTDQWVMLPLDSRVGLQLGTPALPLAVGVRIDF